MTEEAVMDALEDVIDPEIGLSFPELGLIYGVDVRQYLDDDPAAGYHVTVTYTLTTPGCPIAGIIDEQIQQTLYAALPEITEAETELVWKPTWNATMMSEDAKFALGY